MRATAKEKLDEIDSNLERFLELLPDLLLEHRSKFVLMRCKAVIGYFNSAIDAQIAGNQQFGDRVFSIQRVDEPAEELGYFAHAIHSRQT
jgi:hypothetical protein